MAAPDSSEVLAAIDAFVAEQVVPLEERHRDVLGNPRRRYLESGVLSPEVLDLKRRVRTASARAGLYGLFIPAELGGAGKGPRMQYMVWAHLFGTAGPDRPLPLDVLSHIGIPPNVSLTSLSPDLHREVWPGLLGGETVLSFALSEPDASGDVWSMRTTARRDGDEWVVDGTKQWVSRGPYADYAVLFAVSDPVAANCREGGITALVVPMSVPGVRVESVTGLLGRVGGEEALLSLSGVRVPTGYVLGEPGQGAAVAASGTPTGALYTAGRFIGLGRWALERAIQYAKSHAAFGRTVSEIDAARLALADCAIELRAAETMALACADLLQEGSPARQETAMLASMPST